MASKDVVLSIYPDAQVEERFHGTGRRRYWVVFPAPWQNPELGRGFSASEAWDNAAAALIA
jgi:hypothetical protein